MPSKTTVVMVVVHNKYDVVNGKYFPSILECGHFPRTQKRQT